MGTLASGASGPAEGWQHQVQVQVPRADAVGQHCRCVLAGLASNSTFPEETGPALLQIRWVLCLKAVTATGHTSAAGGVKWQAIAAGMQMRVCMQSQV